MNKVFTKNGWEDYIYWQTEDKKTLKKINKLIEDICRNGNSGIGKPEHYWEIYQDSGVEGSMKKIGWSIRLMKKNVYIISCRYHY